ncbi:hypothetical protein BCY91_17210 [Pelobium manganitolerans]|uniref:Uncharacterized protein n=1 Tax=Pelobium manganitolerans TaxID=1842495 RepID=A0A419S6B5_9SPHI|nr:DUF5677 domain-containing protein [Pelobium manganitolerans]RKD16575.1 hypothetical protein BCY91_17210 [Pelobium manganitolerans]
MEKLEKIREIDDEIFECLQEYFPKVKDCNFKKDFPVSFVLILSFDTSANFIKTGILDCAETDNLYGAKILFRSLIEHYLRFKYIFFNWTKTKSDETSEKYFIFSFANDEINSVKAEISKMQLYNPLYKFDSWDDLLKKYSKSEIEKQSVNYTYKNIIKFLIKEMNKPDESQIPFLGNIITEYSKLSSYVHGSILATNETMEFSVESKRMTEIIRISSLATQMSASIKLFSLIMLLQNDREKFTESYLKIDALIKKIPPAGASLQLVPFIKH